VPLLALFNLCSSINDNTCHFKCINYVAVQQTVGDKYNCLLQSEFTSTEYYSVADGVYNRCSLGCSTCDDGLTCLTVKDDLTNAEIEKIVFKASTVKNKSGKIERVLFSLPSNKRNFINVGCYRDNGGASCPIDYIKFDSHEGTMYTGHVSLQFDEDTINTYTFNVAFEASVNETNCELYESNTCPEIFECVVLNGKCGFKTTNSNSNSNQDDSLSAAVLVGITIGCCFFVFMIIIFIVVVVMKTKVKSNDTSDIEVSNL